MSCQRSSTTGLLLGWAFTHRNSGANKERPQLRTRLDTTSSQDNSHRAMSKLIKITEGKHVKAETVTSIDTVHYSQNKSFSVIVRAGSVTIAAKFSSEEQAEVNAERIAQEVEKASDEQHKDQS